MRADHYPRDAEDCPDPDECASYYHQYLEVATCPCCGRPVAT